MGSMARDEMCPYSDIEFAFVIEKNTPQALNYFHTLAQLLELKILNLGEAKYPVFGEEHLSPTPDGFCMDTGGNTPLNEVFDLIDTPQNLAQLETSEWIDQELVLANVMSCVCLVAGDQRLVDAYNTQKTKTLKQKPSFFGIENREKLAMRLLAQHLSDFAPDLSQNKEQHIKALGIRKSSTDLCKRSWPV